MISIKHNSDWGRYELCCMYLYGRGVDRDIDKAAWWLAHIGVYEAVDTDIAVDIAECYRKGDGVPKNLDKAVTWYEFAFDELAFDDCEQAMCILGEIYFNGDENFEKNIDTAIKWYEKAAEHGNVEAMHKLGNIYRYGQGVEIDLSKSVYWMDKALKKYLETAE